MRSTYLKLLNHNLEQEIAELFKNTQLLLYQFKIWQVIVIWYTLELTRMMMV